MSELKLLEVGTIVYSYTNGPMTVINSYHESCIDKTPMFEVQFSYRGKKIRSYFEYASLGKHVFEEKDIDLIGCEKHSEKFIPNYMKMNKYFVSEEGAALIEKAMRIKGKRTNHNKKCMLRAYNSDRKKTIIYIGNGLECFKKYIDIMINSALRNQYDNFDITTVYEETHKKPINIYEMY